LRLVQQANNLIGLLVQQHDDVLSSTDRSRATASWYRIVRNPARAGRPGRTGAGEPALAAARRAVRVKRASLLLHRRMLLPCGVPDSSRWCWSWVRPSPGG